ncbi:DinB family protein [Citricoccus muralis]|uniref:DinB family protein n=1 Tax=Citricoccus muralis TaxID=169134 RepID=A0A3D9LED5_9MICC|nr:DinB family protein [Citricoccus muralis]REE04512.1 DinB family protein [Citricoccus muralis]
MPSTPPPPVPGDDRDWTFVITDGCPDCGFQPLPPAELADVFVKRSTRWRDVLSRTDAAQRPAPTVWSRLEYAGHVRDMLAVLQERVEAMLGQEGPVFADWDGDAKAVELEYWNEDPQQTLAELQRSAAQVGRLLHGVTALGWERSGRRSDGMSFTVATMSQYIAHEMEHHLHDVGA